jgi:hypothetical protein
VILRNLGRIESLEVIRTMVTMPRRNLSGFHMPGAAPSAGAERLLTSWSRMWGGECDLVNEFGRLRLAVTAR